MTNEPSEVGYAILSSGTCPTRRRGAFGSGPVPPARPRRRIGRLTLVGGAAALGLSFIQGAAAEAPDPHEPPTCAEFFGLSLSPSSPSEAPAQGAAQPVETGKDQGFPDIIYLRDALPGTSCSQEQVLDFFLSHGWDLDRERGTKGPAGDLEKIILSFTYTPPWRGNLMRKLIVGSGPIQRFDVALMGDRILRAQTYGIK